MIEFDTFKFEFDLMLRNFFSIYLQILESHDDFNIILRYIDMFFTFFIRHDLVKFINHYIQSSYTNKRQAILCYRYEKFVNNFKIIF